MLIPSTITALRTRRYTSTLYIRRTIHGVGYNPMNDGRRYTIRSPILSNLPPARPTLSPPFTGMTDGEFVGLWNEYLDCYSSEPAVREYVASTNDDEAIEFFDSMSSSSDRDLFVQLLLLGAKDDPESAEIAASLLLMTDDMCR